jgi:hypothetical protein
MPLRGADGRAAAGRIGSRIGVLSLLVALASLPSDDSAVASESGPDAELMAWLPPGPPASDVASESCPFAVALASLPLSASDVASASAPFAVAVAPLPFAASDVASASAPAAWQSHCWVHARA